MKRIGILLMAAVFTVTGGAIAGEVAFAVRSGNISMAYIHQELDTHGTWAYHEDYGRVWCPAVAIHDNQWRPYLDSGRWVQSPYGWYWQSEYEWGEVAFHYGRWVYASPMGWIWVPGVEWAPAWVVWRESASYCGWAPIPPEVSTSASFGFSWSDEGTTFDIQFGLGSSHYVFVPESDFLRPCLPSYRVPSARCEPVYHETRWRSNHDRDRHEEHREYREETPRHEEHHRQYEAAPQYVEPQPKSQPSGPGSVRSMSSGGRLSRIVNSSGASRSGASGGGSSQPAASQAPATSRQSSPGGRASRITSSSSGGTQGSVTAQTQKQSVNQSTSSSGSAQPASRGSTIRELYADRRGR